LVNRVLISSGSSVSIVSGEIYPAAESIATGSVLAPSLLDQLFDELSTNEDPAYLLRKIVRIVMNTGEVTQDPRELYMSATKSIQDIDTQDDIRLTLTQEYALRILQLQSKKYEEIINRNLNTNLSAAPEEDMEYMPVNLGD